MHLPTHVQLQLRALRDVAYDQWQRHPKHYLMVLGVALLSLTGGAYAVANFGPDAARLPVQLVTVNVESEGLKAQAELLDTHNIRLFRTDVSRASDNADSLLSRLGVVDQDASSFIRQTPALRQALLSRNGRQINAEINDRAELIKLTSRWLARESDAHFQRLVIERKDGQLSYMVSTAPLTASVRLSGGTVQSSLYATTDEARIPDSVSTQLTEIFSGHIDFHRALRKGDRFSVVYETLEADGEPLRAGRVLSAEFINAGKSYQAMWFQEPGQKGAYYTLDGMNLRRAYLASPVPYSRLTSGFKMRFHPILQTWRAHLGLDYAAPVGTPVRVIGDGVVEFAGWQNGYGNTVIVRHRNGQHSTLYGHLSRVGVRKGQSVTQGDNIGAVGATGWATGPHLHFEFRVNGRHVDPRTLALHTESLPIQAASRPAFNKAAQNTRKQLALAGQMRGQTQIQ